MTAWKDKQTVRWRNWLYALKKYKISATLIFTGSNPVLTTNNNNMRLIKLTSTKHSDVYINVEQIGHFFEIEGHSCTSVGVTTYNNDGFRVKETPKEILELIEKSFLTLNSETHFRNLKGR